MRSPSGSDSARFSFELEEAGSNRVSAEPEVRRIERPRFAASVGRKRPELDSEPDPEESARVSGDSAPGEFSDDEPPLDMPMVSSARAEPEPKDALDVLGTIRKALRSGRPPRAQPRALEWGESPEVRAALQSEVPLARQSSGRSSIVPRRRSKALGPLAAFAALGLTYLISTSSLVALGPRLARTGPRVPDLGVLGDKKALAAPERAEKTAQVGEPTPEIPKAKEPFIESGAPLPEGMSYPGKGLIEIVTSERELIYVDSIFLGRGPLRRVPVLPGEHAVKIRSGGTERGTRAHVRPAETTRVHFQGDPHLVDAEGAARRVEELD